MAFGVEHQVKRVAGLAFGAMPGVLWGTLAGTEGQDGGERGGDGLDTPLVALFAKAPDRTRADNGISWHFNDQMTAEGVSDEARFREAAAAIKRFGERVIDRKS